MATDSVDPELATRLQELGREPGGSVKVEEIAEVVEAILTTMQGDLSAVDVRLYEELESLSRFISEAKSDIAALRPDEVKDEFLPKAADELDAIVEATAEATNSIMDAVGEIEEVMSKLKGKNSERLMDATTKIYEACGFQDITGQRITKVVGALQHIEEKVDALLNAFGDEIAKYKAANPKTEEAPVEEVIPADEDLLHGPQKKEAAMSQADIDALLNSFD
ncbi:MAG TPA: chemotaxis protein CheZ [Rhodospirillaceae bacterium]|nr:chemotaxis protein CheZ [Magnetovibrio sp.]HBT43938.1 chemotaxis protein CheZ [Rhodospirillaceae bacterium]HCS70781.1 chemotaxis protein CheZ [Rhodospirillaceae bacterium]|tara:strand:+ start:982 stop:1647 length:666 start_codon:yes stop_codon:yes gene_type:complete